MANTKTQDVKGLLKAITNVHENGKEGNELLIASVLSANLPSYIYLPLTKDHTANSPVELLMYVNKLGLSGEGLGSLKNLEKDVSALGDTVAKDQSIRLEYVVKGGVVTTDDSEPTSEEPEAEEETPQGSTTEETSETEQSSEENVEESVDNNEESGDHKDEDTEETLESKIEEIKELSDDEKERKDLLADMATKDYNVSLKKNMKFDNMVKDLQEQLSN